MKNPSSASPLDLAVHAVPLTHPLTDSGGGRATADNGRVAAHEVGRDAVLEDA